MEKLMIVTSISEVREFKGNDGSPVKAVDLTLSDGINTIIASAVDKKAQRIIDHPIPLGSLIFTVLNFNVVNVKTEKGEFVSQRVKLVEFGILANP